MTDDAIPDEVEVKLEAAAADTLVDIAALRALGPYRLRPRRTQHLETLYLDTPGFALARAGVALRVRRVGRRWEATAKWPGRVVGALHERPELTVPLAAPPAAPFVLPAGPLHEHLTPYVLGRPLQPILQTIITRRLVDVLPADAPAAPLAEVALDTVQLAQADGAPVAAVYWEVEIEQRGGTARDCLAVARALRGRFGLVTSRATKYARGLAAAHGEAAPSGAGPRAIGLADTLASATRATLAAHLAALRAAEPGARAGRDPEALHAMRVALRRLRTALRLGGDALPAGPRARLASELGWLGGELGRVRDLDVQLAQLDWHRLRLAPAARRPLDGFRRHLGRARIAARAALVVALDTRRYTALLLALERTGVEPRRPSAGAAAEPIARAGRRAIKRAMRRLLARGAAIDELPAAADLHALRIRAKRLRYILEALKPITGAPGRRLARQLARLQDVLGRFNDAMVAAGVVRGYVEAHGDRLDREGRAALSAVGDAELRRAGAAQAQFHHAWDRFAGKATRRRRRALLAALKSAADADHPAPARSA